MLLADTYVHVEYSGTENFRALARRLEPGVISIAKEIFISHAEIEYLLDEGTLIQRSRVRKALYAVFATIVGYHAFRESVIDIYHDAELISHKVVEEFYKITGTSPSSTIYKRAIPTDVKRLHRIIQNIDRINSPTLSHREQKNLKREIISDIAGLYYSNPQDNGVQNILDNLPKKRIPELPNTVAAAVEDDQRRRKSEVGKGLARGMEGPPREARPRRRYEHTTVI